MATPTDPATNLALAQQLLTVMADITAQMDKQGKLLQTQNQLFEALCKSQECADGSKVRDLTAAAREAQEELDRTTTTGSKLEEVVKNIGNWASKLSVPAEFLNGFKSGLNLSTNVFKNILSLGGTALGMLKNIGMSLLSLPGKLMDLFQTGGGGADPYRQQLEKLRGEFGNLQIGTSKAILGMMPHMKDFEQSGLRLSRVFGYGREGLAKQLEEFMKIATEMGPVARVFMNAAAASSGLVAALSKSGLGADAFKSLTAASLNGGETVDRAVKGMVKDVARAERTFGISARELQKDVTEISKNFATFGPVARGVMLATSAYVKKLGISIETLKKIADKSFNFEDAAEQAAKLGETFNMALDPMRLMKANPAEKLDMIREAFFKTGKNIEQMTVQERNYLAATAGMSEEEARLAFAQKNRALSNAQLQEQMKKSQKTPITQAEAMQTLAKSIERLVQSGSGMKGSFIDIFFKGFERGIRRSKEFRDVVRNLQRSLRTVYFAGVEVGRMFVKEFPGIKTMLLALKDMFDPRRFRELMGRVVGEFRRFFQALQTDPKAGVKVFMTNMKKIFFDFFNKGAPAGGRFLDGLKMFFKTVGVIFVQGLQYAFESLRDVLKFVIETIKDPSRLKAGAVEVGGGIAGMFQQAFAYVATELGPVLKELGGQLVELLTMVFERYIKPHLQHLVGAIFGPALFFGVARAVGAALIQTIFTTTFMKFFNKIPGTPSPTNPADALRELKNFAVTLAKIAMVMVAIAVTVRLLMPVILSIAKSIDESGVSKESLIFTTVLLGMFGILFGAIGLLMKQLQPLANAGMGAGKILGYMTVIGLAIVGIAVTAAIAVRMFAGITPEQALTTAIAVGTMGAVFGAIGGLLILLGAQAAPGTAAALPAMEYMLIVGAAVLAIGLAAMLAVAIFGKMKMEDVLVTVAAVGGMAFVFGAVGTLIALLGGMAGVGIPAAGIAAVYLGVVAVAILAIGAAAYAAVKAFGSMKMEDVAVTLAAIGGMALVFGAVGALIVLLGSFALAGMAGAVLAMPYMLIIGVFIYKLVDFGKNLVRSVSSMKEEDIKKAVTLLDGMGDIVSNVASALAKVSLVAGLTGGIGALVGLYVLGIAVGKVVEWTKEMVAQMSGVNITEERAKAFGAILGAMGTLIKNVAEAISEIAGGGSVSLRSMISGVDNSTIDAGARMVELLPIIKTMVDGILTSVSGIQGDPSTLKAKADVFAAIATGIGAVLKPIADTIKALSDSATAGWFTDAVDLSTVTTGIQIFLSQLLNPTTGLIPLLLQSFQNLSPSQAEGLKAGGEILKNIISPIADLVKVLPEMIKAVAGMTSGITGSSITDVTTALNSISGMVVAIVNGITGAVSTMLISIGVLLAKPEITPAKLEAAKSFGDIFKGIGELIKVIMPSTEILNRIAPLTDDSAAADNAAKITAYLAQMNTTLNTLLNGDPAHPEGGVKNFISSLLTSLSSANLTETSVKGLTVIGTIISSITSIIGPIMSAMQGFTTSIKGGTPEQTAQIGLQMQGIIWSLTGSLTQVFEKIPEFVGLLVNMNFGRGGTRGLNAKVAAIKGIFEFVSSVLTVVTSIRGAAGGGAPIADIYGQVFAPVMQLLHYIFGGDRDVGSGGAVSLQRIITSINGLTGLKGLGAKVAVLKSLFEAIGVIATTAKTLKETFAGAAAITAEQLTPGFTSIKAVLDAFLDGGPAAFLANMDMTNITKAHNKLVGSGGRGSSGIGAKLGAIGTAFSGMLTGMTTIKTELTNFGTQFPAGGSTFDFATVERVTTDLLHKMDELAERLAGSDSGMIQRITETFTGRGFMAKVRTAVQSYNSFSRELSGLRGGDVNVSLRALNNSLVGRANQDLASTSARINVNVNVRMDAANVSRVLYDYSHTEQSNVNGDAHGPTGAIRTNAYNTTT